MLWVRTVGHLSSEILRNSRTEDIILEARLLTMIRQIVAFDQMRNDAVNCIIVRSLTRVGLVHHRQGSQTFDRVQNERKPRLQYRHAAGQPNRVPRHPRHAQEYQRLQVASRRAQAAMMMTIRRIVQAVVRETESAHQAVEDDSARWSFAVSMRTIHSVPHGLFAFLVDSRFTFRYHFTVTTVAVI